MALTVGLMPCARFFKVRDNAVSYLRLPLPYFIVILPIRFLKKGSEGFDTFRLNGSSPTASDLLRSS